MTDNTIKEARSLANSALTEIEQAMLITNPDKRESALISWIQKYGVNLITTVRVCTTAAPDRVEKTMAAILAEDSAPGGLIDQMITRNAAATPSHPVIAEFEKRLDALDEEDQPAVGEWSAEAVTERICNKLMADTETEDPYILAQVSQALAAATRAATDAERKQSYTGAANIVRGYMHFYRESLTKPGLPESVEDIAKTLDAEAIRTATEAGDG